MSHKSSFPKVKMEAILIPETLRAKVLLDIREHENSHKAAVKRGSANHSFA